MVLLNSCYDSGENEVLIVKIWARVPDLWAQVALNEFLSLRPQGQKFFWNFIVLLDSSYDCGKIQVLFVKIGARVPDLWLDTIFRPKLP